MSISSGSLGNPTRHFIHKNKGDSAECREEPRTPSASLLCVCWSSVMIVVSLSQRGDRCARALGKVRRGPRGPQRGRTTSKVRRVWLVNGITWAKNPSLLNHMHKDADAPAHSAPHRESAVKNDREKAR